MICSEKYPAEGDFEAYLAKNGGSTNAYTDMEDTNYYFSITPGDDDDDALSGALDRFAQFFICPTFETSAGESAHFFHIYWVFNTSVAWN